VPYLDYAATAPLRAEVLEAMRPFLERPAANPSSQHGPGRAARAAVETAREQVAALVGAQPAQVIFTSGGTEADNLAVKGTMLLREPNRERHLVVSAVEHHAVLDAAEWAVLDAGATVALAPVDGLGRLDLDRLGELLSPGRTALVAVMAANNEVGTLQPVAAAAELAHAAGAVLLCDAVQAARHPGVDMADGPDLVALAAHKLGGPTGVGALVTRAGLPLRPLLHGGGQERGMRSGTLPVAAIVGFGAAAALARAERSSGAGVLLRLRQRLLDGLRSVEPDLEVNGDLGASLPGLLSVRLPGRRSEDVLLLLDRDQVACSAGSACASGATGASHVLLAMGRTPVQARETIRLSLGHGSTETDVDAAVAAVRHALAVLAPQRAALGSAP
jgi:cysteine desulfurase